MQRLKEQGTTVILVEQSVNVALTVAETAYFMEKGEIRFHGPTSELLERKDVLRSVFLEGAASVELDAGKPAIVHVVGDVVGSVAPTANGGNGASAPDGAISDPRLQVEGVSKYVRRHQRAQRRVVRGARRRGARVPRSERRGQDDVVRRAVGLSSRASGATSSSTASPSPSSVPTPGPGAGSGARSRTAGCSRHSP